MTRCSTLGLLLAGLLSLAACGGDEKGPTVLPGMGGARVEGAPPTYDRAKVEAMVRENLGDLSAAGKAMGRPLVEADVVAMLDVMEQLQKGDKAARGAITMKNATLLMRWPQVAAKFAVLKAEMEGTEVPQIPGLTVLSDDERAILKRHMDRFVRFSENDDE